jgi:hypothetical protein
LLIEDSVHHLDRQQHFGPPAKPREPFLISLFAKWFRDEFPFKSFLMLVAGQRRGQSIEVHQAWRLYPSYVKFSDEMDLVDLLRSFADTYGVDLAVGGYTGHFILAAEIDSPAQITVRVPDNTTATVSHFWQADPKTGKRQAALIVGINLDLYERTLRKMR